MNSRDYEKGCVERALASYSVSKLTGQGDSAWWQQIISSMPQDMHDILKAEHQRELVAVD